MTTQPKMLRELIERARREAPGLPEPTVQPTAYAVSCLPEGDGRRHFTIDVTQRHPGRWAVGFNGLYFAPDSTWSWEIHTYDRDTALAHAREQAKLVIVSTRTVTDALRMHQQQEEDA